MINFGNGKNFLGSEKFQPTVDWDNLRFKTAEQKNKWKFNPPSAAVWADGGSVLFRLQNKS